jgi:hypothetical protein
MGLGYVDGQADSVSSFKGWIANPIQTVTTISGATMKMYNLCRIKKVGLDPWIEEAGEIRKKYFKGKFVVGKGQVD